MIFQYFYYFILATQDNMEILKYNYKKIETFSNFVFEINVQI